MSDTTNADQREIPGEGVRQSSAAEQGGARASAAGLSPQLDDLVRAAEAQSTQQVVASILLIAPDGKHLIHGAAPSLPEEYCRAIDGIEIGPSQGSCGTAAHYRRTVVVDDIQQNALWTNFKDLAGKHGLRACWSTPIVSSDGNSVLGTFALYHRTVAVPSKHDIDLVLTLVNTARDLIERAR